jgi:hypothetical protein
MLKTLERYQKCNYGAPEPNVSAREALVRKFTLFLYPLNFPLSSGPLFNLPKYEFLVSYIETNRFAWQ